MILERLMRLDLWAAIAAITIPLAADGMIESRLHKQS
jgi:hypothetical protein